MIATWKADYCTGHIAVDGQHREIFRLVNQFSEAVATRRARALMRPVIDRLVSYVAEHFEEEERLMRRAGFPDRTAHAAAHAAFGAQVQEVARAYQAGELVLPITLSQFMLDWLDGHIKVSDQALVEWLDANPGHAARALTVGR